MPCKHRRQECLLDELSLFGAKTPTPQVGFLRRRVAVLFFRLAPPSALGRARRRFLHRRRRCGRCRRRRCWCRRHGLHINGCGRRRWWCDHGRRRRRDLAGLSYWRWLWLGACFGLRTIVTACPRQSCFFNGAKETALAAGCLRVVTIDRRGRSIRAFTAVYPSTFR